MIRIHDTAVIDSGARIGNGTSIWHFCHVSSTARIGRNCILGQNVYIGPGVVIGDGVKIQNNVSVYEGVEIEDNVFIGPSVVFTNMRKPVSVVSQREMFEKTIVRKGATIGANSTIICGNVIGEKSFVAACSLVTKNVEDEAFVMGQPAKFVDFTKRKAVCKRNIQSSTLFCQEGDEIIIKKRMGEKDHSEYVVTREGEPGEICGIPQHYFFDSGVLV